MKPIHWGLAGMLVLGLMVGWWWMTRVPVPAAEKTKPVNEVLSSDWYVGDLIAPIKVIEYSDFQCPACAMYSGVHALLSERFPGQVVFAYRQFPLRQIHKQADLAAYAAEVAGKQGKFWEMSKLLFENQEQWSGNPKALSLMGGYAAQLGMDTQAFAKQIDDQEIKSFVEADYLSGLMAKINSTPTFYVNGQKMNNLGGPEDLVARIELALQDATAAARVQ